MQEICPSGLRRGEAAASLPLLYSTLLLFPLVPKLRLGTPRVEALLRERVLFLNLQFSFYNFHFSIVPLRANED